MMKYSIALLFCIALLPFVSCLESTENNDRTPPTIDSISANRNDTIWYVRKDKSPSTGNDTVFLEKITMNQSGNDIDTLVMGHKLRFRAGFSDDEALSSYYYLVSSASDNEGLKGDTAYYARKVGRLLTQQRDSVNTGEVEIWKDSISVDNKMKAVLQGDYRMKVFLLDAAGNESTASRDLKLLSRDSIIKIRTK